MYNDGGDTFDLLTGDDTLSGNHQPPVNTLKSDQLDGGLPDLHCDFGECPLRAGSVPMSEAV